MTRSKRDCAIELKCKITSNTKDNSEKLNIAKKDIHQIRMYFKYTNKDMPNATNMHNTTSN